MKIGISALLFNLEQGLDICSKNKKIEHIEIGLDNLEDALKLKKYKEQIKKLNLSVSIHLPMELNTCESIDYIRDSWVNFICKMHRELKDDFDIKYYNLHLGYVIGKRLQKNRERYLKNTVEFLNSLNLKDSLDNAFISIENTYSVNLDSDFTNVGNCVEDFEYIFNNTKNDKVFFCYDTGHDLLNRSEYRRLLNKINVIHFSDNDGVCDTHVGYKMGILNEEIKDIFEYIYTIKPQYLILEIDYSCLHNTIKYFSV